MTILSITLKASLLILLLLLFESTLGRRFSAKCRYALWLVLLLRLAIPAELPLYTITLPEMKEPAPVVIENKYPTPALREELLVSPTPMIPSQPVFTPAIPSVPTTTLPPSTIPAQTAPSSEPFAPPAVIPEPTLRETLSEAIAALLPKLREVLPVIWLAGAGFFALSRLISYLIYAGWLKRSCRLAEDKVYGVYCTLLEKHGISRAPALYVSDRVGSPILFGFFSPAILLPPCVDEDEAVAVLSHELTHYKRADLWVKLLALAATSLHWFNPLVHLASRRCTESMELSCDEAVLAGMNSAVRWKYGTVMFDLLQRSRRRVIPLTTHFNPRKSAVVERFRNILDTGTKRRGLLLIVLAVLLCAVGCTVSVNPEDDSPEVTTEDSADSGQESETNKPESHETKPEETTTETLETEKEPDSAETETLETAIESAPPGIAPAEVVEEDGTEYYPMWYNGLLPITSLLNADTVREDLANMVNETLGCLRDGRDLLEFLPNPPSTEFPMLDGEKFDFNKIGNISAADIPRLFYSTSGKGADTGYCRFKFTFFVDDDIYADFYWDIAQFGDSPYRPYINYVEIYSIAERMEEYAKNAGITDLHYYQRLSIPQNTWFIGGRDATGKMRLLFSENNGEHFVEVENSNSGYLDGICTWCGVIILPTSVAESYLVELHYKMPRGSSPVEYVRLSYNEGGSLEGAFACSAQELISLTQQYDVRLTFPNRNLGEHEYIADDLTELSHLYGTDGDPNTSPTFWQVESIRAVLTKNMETIEQLWMNGETGMYEKLRDTEIIYWLAYADYRDQYAPKVYLYLITHDTNNQSYTPSYYQVLDGMLGYGLASVSEGSAAYSEAEQAVADYLNIVGADEILTADSLNEYRTWQLTDYLCSVLYQQENKRFFTREELAAAAEKIFGIKDFIPSDSQLQYGASFLDHKDAYSDDPSYNFEGMTADNIYAGAPHGGLIHSYRILESESKDDGGYTVKVQFYADPGCLVESHLIEYDVEESNGLWIFRGCSVVERGRYEPFRYRL